MPVQTVTEPTATSTGDTDTRRPFFAPLRIPLQRRLQTLATLVCFATPVVCLTANILLPVYAPPVIFYLYLMMLAYSVFFLSSHVRGGLPMGWLRSSVLCRYFRDYFPVTVHCDPALSLTGDRPYIIGYHPHGILSVGAVIGFGTTVSQWHATFPHINTRLVTLDQQFRIPFWNLVLLALGAIGSSRASFEWMLSRAGNAVVVVLGGAAESLDAFVPTLVPPQSIPTAIPSTPSSRSSSANTSTANGHSSGHRHEYEHDPVKSATNTTEISHSPSASETGVADSSAAQSSSLPSHSVTNPVLLHLNHRRGFVVLALLHGAALLPAFAFGELSLWSQVPNPRGSRLRRVQEYVTSVIGFAPPLAFGRGIFQYHFGVLPRRQPIDIHIGQCVECPKVSKSELTSALIEDYYCRYQQSLIAVFEANKRKYSAMERATLVFVD